MSKNCKCKKCVTYCCEEIVCNDPCVLLTEPCNPCPPKQVTYCVPNPPCPQPCPPYPCPPYPCPTPCPPSAVNPQYVIYPSTITATTTLTNAIVNNNNMFVINGGTTTITITLPLISTLNNCNKKCINITNFSSISINLAPASTDSLAGATAGTSYTLEGNKSAILYSLPGIASGAGGNTWALTH